MKGSHYMKPRSRQTQDQRDCKPHEWIERSFSYRQRRKRDQCRKCHLLNIIGLMLCPRCSESRPDPNRPGAILPWDPACWICDGRGAFVAPHACICCGSGGLAAGQPMCTPCKLAHGFAGGVCDRQTQDERRQLVILEQIELAPRQPEPPMTPARRALLDKIASLQV